MAKAKLRDEAPRECGDDWARGPREDDADGGADEGGGDKGLATYVTYDQVRRRRNRRAAGCDEDLTMRRRTWSTPRRTALRALDCPGHATT